MSINFRGYELGKAHRLTRSNYIPRVLGFAFSFLVVSLLVLEKGWSLWYFMFTIPSFLIYPHLVLLASKAMPDNKNIEIRAMMFDAFLLGIWAANIHFFLWLSFAFLASVVLNHIMVGGYRQLLKALPLFLGGTVTGGLMTGFRLELEAAYYIEFIAMMALLLYIFGAAGVFYRQTRRLAEIRMELEDKNRQLNDTIQKLHNTKNELVEKAHKAGMADLATGVLHNIGNILNSVNISTTVLNETLKDSKIPKLLKANNLLNQHQDNLREFLLKDPRGMKLLQYYLKLNDPMDDEYKKLQAHCNRLTDKVRLMLEVIDAQQDFAKVGRISEEVQLEQIIEDTLTLQAGSIERHDLDIEKEFADTDEVNVQKSKLIHILINLFSNAKDAMAKNDISQKKITIRTHQDEESVYLFISDSGTGIDDKNINKIFNHGFTTKENGHGYGLHTCANYMTEMGGSIKATSKGSGHGATFILTFPRPGNLNKKNRNKNDVDVS